MSCLQLNSALLNFELAGQVILFCVAVSGSDFVEVNNIVIEIGYFIRSQRTSCFSPKFFINTNLSMHKMEK